MQGEIEASINLTRYQVKPNSFITILPGTIFQIHKVEGDLQIYFMGFSSEFSNQANIGKSAMDMQYAVKDSPIIELKEQPAQLLEDYFSLLIKTYEFCGPKLNQDILVMQNYTTQRSVAWYAKKLGITPAHLSTIVKQTTDKTCIEIISSMVIMDAKAQLKSTDLSIHDIAYSLNFTNMSFFGKYFKRHVGIGPQEYRNS